METSQKAKFGFWSIVLLGINGIIGTGIFLLPNKAYALTGVSSLFILLFDAFLAGCIALCFAEAAGLFSRNGGPYLYAKHAFGDFVGYEVGVLKWFVTVIAWAVMSVGFATALIAAFPQYLEGELTKNIIATSIVVFFTIINIIGVNATKILGNIITVSKLVPLVVFIAAGLFFVHGGNFVPIIPPEGIVESKFAQAALILFFAYTGFEAIAIAAEDMENPKKNLPRAIILVMIIVSIMYMLILGVTIGINGEALTNQPAPLQAAFQHIFGPVGEYFILAGTLISMGGINMAQSFLGPRVLTALAEDGMVPGFLAKRTAWNTPYVASIVTAVVSIGLAWTGSFAQLAAISSVSRFTQYLPTCVAVLVYRKKWADRERSYTIPGGYTIPIIAIVISLWMLANTSGTNLLWGLGGLIIIFPYYFVYKNKKDKGLIKESDEV